MTSNTVNGGNRISFSPGVKLIQSRLMPWWQPVISFFSWMISTFMMKGVWDYSTISWRNLSILSRSWLVDEKPKSMKLILPFSSAWKNSTGGLPNINLQVFYNASPYCPPKPIWTSLFLESSILASFSNAFDKCLTVYAKVFSSCKYVYLVVSDLRARKNSFITLLHGLVYNLKAITSSSLSLAIFAYSIYA